MKDKVNIVFDANTFRFDKSGLYTVAYNVAVKWICDSRVILYFYSENIDIINKTINIFNSYNIKFIHKDSIDWLNIDVYYSPYFKIPDFILGNKNIQKYTTLHDVTPILFPYYFTSTKDYYDIINSINNKDYYFSVSINTKNDFIKYVPNINNEHIYITYLGRKDFLRYIDYIDYNILSKYNIPHNKKYVFSLCSIEPRKNLIRVIRTFCNFLDKHNVDDLVLVLGGKQWGNFLDEFNSEVSKYKDRIIVTGFIDDDDLSYLYSNAQWFIYTSEYEGFGLPPLEAMACKCPVITSNNSSLPEVVADCGIMVTWNSDEEHIEAYEKYYFDNSYRNEMSVNGYVRSKLFSWEICANEMVRVIFNNIEYTSFFKVYKSDYKIYIKIFKFNFFIPNIRLFVELKDSDDKRFKVFRFLFIKISIRNSKRYIK